MTEKIVIVEVSASEKIGYSEYRYNLTVDGKESHWWLQCQEYDEGYGEEKQSITIWSAHALWPNDPDEYHSQGQWDGMVNMESEEHDARTRVLYRCVTETLGDRKMWEEEEQRSW